MDDIQARSKKRAMTVLIGCCIVQFCGMGTIFDSASAFFMVVPDAVGLGMGEFAIWISASTITSAIAMFFIGHIVDRFDMKAVLTFCAIGSAIAVACFSVATQVWQLIIIGGVIGCTAAIYFQYSTPALINAWFTKKPGFYLGLAVAIGGIGSAIWPIVFTVLIASVGYQVAYIINACILLVAILPFSLTVFSVKPEKYGLQPYGGVQQEAKEEVKYGLTVNQAVKTSVFFVMILACAFCSFFGCYSSFMQDFTIEVLGPEYILFSATMMTSLQIGYILASLLLGTLCDKFGVHRISCILFAITAVVMILFTFVRVPAAMLVLAFFFGMSTALFMVSVPLLVRDTVGTKDYDRFLGYGYMGCNIVTAIWSTGVGVCYDMTGSYNLGFIIAAAVCVLLIVLFLATKALKKKAWAKYGLEDELKEFESISA